MEEKNKIDKIINNKKKCYYCNKKLKLLDEYICKCKNYFCAKHRLCHMHNCQFIKKVEYKQNCKKIIKEENPKIKGKKIEKI